MATGTTPTPACMIHNTATTTATTHQPQHAQLDRFHASCPPRSSALHSGHVSATAPPSTRTSRPDAPPLEHDPSAATTRLADTSAPCANASRAAFHDALTTRHPCHAHACSHRLPFPPFGCYRSDALVAVCVRATKRRLRLTRTTLILRRLFPRDAQQVGIRHQGVSDRHSLMVHSAQQRRARLTLRAGMRHSPRNSHRRRARTAPRSDHSDNSHDDEAPQESHRHHPTRILRSTQLAPEPDRRRTTREPARPRQLRRSPRRRAPPTTRRRTRTPPRGARARATGAAGRPSRTPPCR